MINELVIAPVWEVIRSGPALRVSYLKYSKIGKKRKHIPGLVVFFPAH
jgi:hypothetical protein